MNPNQPNTNNALIRRMSKAVTFFPLIGWLRLTKKLDQTKAAVNFVLHHKTISALQVPAELLELANLIATRKPKTVLEIGTALGGTLLLMCRLSDPNATIISLDLADRDLRYRGYREPIFRSFPRKRQKLHLVLADSHREETKHRIANLLEDKGLDILFIDGDHSYGGVRSDFEMYSPFVRQGGIVIFHDIVEHSPEKCCEVNRFWMELRQQYRYHEIIENPNQGWAGIGIIYL
jgi:predicted O-methyltransferase YrrM